MLQLAESILIGCKQGRLVATLETAIFLLRQVLDQQASSHPLRSNTAHHLGIALLTRFNQWGWYEDLEEVVILYEKHIMGVSSMIESVRQYPCLSVFVAELARSDLEHRHNCTIPGS